MGRVVGLTFEEIVASAVTMPDPEGTENKDPEITVGKDPENGKEESGETPGDPEGTENKAAKPKGTAKKG